MQEHAGRLIELLEEELRLNQGLHDLGLRKRDELVALDHAAVEKTNREEQAVLVALGETGKRRLQAMQSLATLLQVSEQEATVRGLASRLPQELRARMFSLAQDLRSAMTRVARVNESNRILTEQSLRYVHDFFSALTGTEEATYGRQGKRNSRPGRLMIDQVI